MSEERKLSNSYSTALVVILLVIALPGLLIPEYMLVAWLLTLLLMTLFTLIVGKGLCGRWVGVLVDERNYISLSRFQIVIWTLVVISAILVAFLSNISRGVCDPLEIEIPTELWILMGISATSSVASPLIKNSKMENTVSPQKLGEFKVSLERRGILLDAKDDKADFDNKGEILVRKDLRQAQLIDMFKGEKLNDGGHLDFAKIQMFYFTIILVIAYVIVIGVMFLNANETDSPIERLPPFNSTMLTLIGISHGAHLTSKAMSGPSK